MSAFPHFSNIAHWVTKELDARKQDIIKVSNLNAWVRVSSGVGKGCIMLSNPNSQLFGGVGDKVAPSIYGTDTHSGTIGVQWDGVTPVSTANEYWGFRPKPNITTIEIEEGAGSLSRKATFTITAYTRAQLDELCKYYLEPGYTIFLEWGWNTLQGVSMYSPALTGAIVGANQSFVEVNRKRAASEGHYDNYLGFISGGNVAMEGDKWTITVKCTGFTELPAYMTVTSNSDTRENIKKTKPATFKPSEITAETNLGKKRFMMAFNRLPSNKQSESIAGLIKYGSIASVLNFVNVDEDVKENINDTTSGFEILGISINDEEIKTNGQNVEVPSGTEIIGDEAFIRFGTLMDIMNMIGAGSLDIGGVNVSMTINTKKTIISAFKNIYSTDKSKLLIPNANAPQFSLAQAASSVNEQDTFAETANCSISDGAAVVQFPYSKAIKSGTVDGISIQYTASSIEGISKAAYMWGFLDDLYVNMDFAKGILETENFSIKDALYKLLNGLSSAAGGIWDFQIIEVTTTSGKSTELMVVDLNFMADNGKGMTTFYISGVNSVFLDASFDMDMGGAKMSQIIGKRLGYDLNPNSPSVDGKTSKAVDQNNTPQGQKKGLFTDMQDMVLKVIRPSEGKPPAMSPQQQAQDLAVKQAKAAADKAAAEKVIADKIAAAAAIKKAEDEKAAAAAASSKVTATVTTTAAPEVGFFKGLANSVSTGVTAGVTAIGDGIVQVGNNIAEGTVAAYDTIVEVGGDVGTYVVEKTEEFGTEFTEQFNNLEIVKQFKAYMDKEEAKEKNFKLFMSKIGIYPRVSVTKDTQVSSPETELTSITMAAVYNDQLVFQALKAGYNNVNAYDTNTVSALLPIKFSFTVHGVSGIKRGDKFKVIGIPRQYEQNGFFQVTSVKHTIDAMLWKTEVEGGLRLNK
jgi:hypothetical protein